MAEESPIHADPSAPIDVEVVGETPHVLAYRLWTKAPGEDRWTVAAEGHSEDGVSFVAGNELCFTGDTLFRDAVGGGPAQELRGSVMDVLMTLSPDVRVLPGHTDETTIAREWEENPFVRYWRGLEGEDGRPCRVHGEDATVVVWSPDYDGKGKALVRLAGGDEAIVGASRIEGL